MQGHGKVIAKEHFSRADLQLPVGIVLLPALVTRHIAMYLALMEEEAGVAEGAVMAQGTTEFSLLGVLAVLVIKQGLLVFGLVAAVLALEDGRLVALRMFCLHVFLQLVLALASKATYLTDQGLALVTQLVAAQLVSTMAAVGALVTLIPEISCVLPHVNAEVVLPLCHIATFSTHVVLIIRVGQHVFGKVAHISTSEVTQLAFVRLLS